VSDGTKHFGVFVLGGSCRSRHFSRCAGRTLGAGLIALFAFRSIRKSVHCDPARLLENSSGGRQGLQAPRLNVHPDFDLTVSVCPGDVVALLKAEQF
jgi:hypothetical protein